MAACLGTEDDIPVFEYVPTMEEINTYNEVHHKLVDFNVQILLVDQQLKKLVQECIQRGDNVPNIFKKLIQELKVEQEGRKRRLRGMLMGFFKSKCCDFGNLESFILEQEVYNLMMSTKSDDDLNLLMTQFGKWFTMSVRTSYKKMNSWKRVFDRTPKKMNFRTCSIGQSANRAQSSKPQGLINRSRGAMEMSLSDVVVELYLFSRDMALDIEACVASRTLVSEAFKNDSMSDDLHRNGSGFDPMDYLDHQVLSESCEPEDEETLNWKNVTIMRKKLEDLYREVSRGDKQNVDKGLENILKAIKIWIFHMESVICDLVYNLHAMMSDYEPAMIKFQELNSELKEEKERNNGLVPVIVYKILAMPRISYQGVGFNRDKAVLHKEIGFDEMIRGFKNVITYLGGALIATSRLLDEQRMDQEREC